MYNTPEEEEMTKEGGAVGGKDARQDDQETQCRCLIDRTPAALYFALSLWIPIYTIYHLYVYAARREKLSAHVRLIISRDAFVDSRAP